MENRSKSRLVAGLVCLLALFVLGPQAALAEPNQASPAGGSCLASAGQELQPLWLESTLGCYQQSFCPDDDYCWQLCPTANSAACVNNVCQFSLPGGGGPGGGGNQCPYQSICAEDYHCTFPGGITGTCVNGSCVC